MMSWLKQATLKLNKPPKESIIARLRGNLGGPRQGRSRESLHASDITKSDFCPRRWALLDAKGITHTSEFISVALDATFDMGLAVETLVVEHWAGKYSIGNWQCRLCGEYRSMCSKPDGYCKSGTRHWWKYQQIVIEAPEFGVIGSLDCLFDVGVPKLRVTELKILSTEEFEKIVAPLAEHRLRTSLYLKLLAESNHPFKDRFNLHEGNVVYVSRGYGKLNPQWNEILPFKEFEVQRDDSTLKPALQKAKAVKLFREQQQIPNGICTTALDKVAKKCSVCQECFSGKYTATIQWESL